MTNKLYL